MSGSISRQRNHASSDSSSQDSQPFPPLEADYHHGTNPVSQAAEVAEHRAMAGHENGGVRYSEAYPTGLVQSDGRHEDGTERDHDRMLSPEIEVEDEETDFESQFSMDNDNDSLAFEGESINSDEEDDADEDEDEDEDEESPEDCNTSSNNNVAMRRSYMQSSSSLNGPNAFAPPFYNRPPTPLPPSPSLTSLLRPPFSTTTSRPTTPDTSDAETQNDTEAAVAKSARIATTVPRARPKVPTYEYYGFVLYLTSSFAFLMYLLWSYLPSPFLHQLGIHYYPNRWWSLAIPSYLVMTIVYIYVALASYNTGYLTLPMTSIENIVDEVANIAVIDSKGRRRPGGSEKMKPGSVTSQTMGRQQQGGGQGTFTSWKEIWSEGTDAVMDIPVGGVCEVLYGPEREEDPELVQSKYEPGYQDYVSDRLRNHQHLDGAYGRSTGYEGRW